MAENTKVTQISGIKAYMLKKNYYEAHWNRKAKRRAIVVAKKNDKNNTININQWRRSKLFFGGG